MKSDTLPTPHSIQAVRTLGPIFAERAAAHDAQGRFVADNYVELKQHRLLSAGVPTELGGGGASHRELCQMLSELAHHCPSTALALSMHTHLVAAAVWRYRHGQPGEALLRKVAGSELVLVSTGAGDWVESVGQAERVPGGYRITALKRFASGCLAGDVLITSAPCEEPQRGPEVLHFPVPMRAEGVTIREDWDTLGMRGSGSHSVQLNGVFVPEEAVALRRPRGEWHGSWNLVITVAAPIYTAPYIGIAERARAIARDKVNPQQVDSGVLQSMGELDNSLTTAQMAWREMVELTNDYDVTPDVELANRMLIRKTIATNAAKTTVTKAVEVIGGSAYFKRLGIERLLRDVEAAQFHPLSEKKQLDFSGRVALGLPPVSQHRGV